MITIRTLTFGIEIEMTGISRETAARIIAGYFQTTASHVGGVYDAYTIRDPTDRIWKIVRDSSIAAECHGRSAGPLYQVEFVSPICVYDDIETVQNLVRELRRGGSFCNSSTGIHVHIGGEKFTPQTLKNLVNIFAAKEDLIYKAFNVDTERIRFCKKMDTRFLDDVNRVKPKTMAEMNHLWYNGNDRSSSHYDQSRYRGLNLHSLFSRGTIEYRLFNGDISHCGRIKAYIQFCLAVSHQALVQKGAQYKRTETENDKYSFRCWLLRLGMIGDEFKTARKFLLENLDGNIAWRDPSQAEAQKQRLALQQNENHNTEVHEHTWELSR